MPEFKYLVKRCVGSPIDEGLLASMGRDGLELVTCTTQVKERLAGALGVGLPSFRHMETTYIYCFKRLKAKKRS